jgi:two-component system phosphate regulon sensor histidine kinase PhoR
MAAGEDISPIERRPGLWSGRPAGTYWALGAAAIVLVAFVLTGALPAAYALAGFAVVVVAALIGAAIAARARPAPAAIERAAPHTDAAFLDTLMTGMPDPVAVLDREGIVVAFNAAVSAIAPALRHGEPASLALRMPALVEAIRRAGSTGESQRIEFSERVPIDRWYAAWVNPVRQNGAVALVIVTFHDLTPLRRIEEMRADFVANASHELRTPLAALAGFIETLQGSARDDTAARERFLAIMKQQATRMARLIDDLLSLSRVELNAHVRPETPVDLVAIVRQVADGLQMLAADRGVTIALAAPPEPIVVPGDRDELLRLFENLIENALKYGAAGKRIEVAISAGTAADGGTPEVVVAVRDHGPGIAPEHLPRLTERFYRVDVGQSRAEGGTGLGLALVKHILARHRGRLAIDSILGDGATFTVRLPLSPAVSPANG